MVVGGVWSDSVVALLLSIRPSSSSKSSSCPWFSFLLLMMTILLLLLLSPPTTALLVVLLLVVLRPGAEQEVPLQSELVRVLGLVAVLLLSSLLLFIPVTVLVGPLKPALHAVAA